MKKSNLFDDRVRTFYYKLHKISINRSGGLYIESPDWIKNKKATINPKNKNDDNCMHYAISIALNYEKIDNHQDKKSKIKPLINMYDWKDINIPSHKKIRILLRKIVDQLLLIFFIFLTILHR